MPRVPPRGLATFAILAATAAAFSAVSLGLPWYQTSTSYGGSTLSIAFSPGADVRERCSGNLSQCGGGVVLTSVAACGSIPVTSYSPSSYSAAGLPRTGTIYAVAWVLAAGAVAVGCPAIGLSWRFDRRGPRGRKLATALSVAALELIAFAALVIPPAQPAALRTDGLSGAAPGPAVSFAGTCSVPISGASETSAWGPAAGWFVAVGAVALLAGAVIVRWRAAPPRS